MCSALDPFDVGPNPPEIDVIESHADRDKSNEIDSRWTRSGSFLSTQHTPTTHEHKYVPKMNDYETQRAAKIAKNQALLAELNIKPLGPQRESRQKRTNGGDQPPTKKRRLQQDTAPSRVSARLASAPLKPNYTDEPDIKPVPLPRSAGRSTKKDKLGSIVKEETEALVPVKDIDEIRSGWSSWDATAPEPTRDENAVFRFEDEESFTPNKSPEEMLREGVFGGS